jgi:phosphoribosylformylglycinamidine synthase
LNNEFSYDSADGRKTISIPPTLLISALGQVDDVSRCVTMDVKQAGNVLYQIGLTKNELGGSLFAELHRLAGGQVPTVDTQRSVKIFAALHQAIQQGLVAACHDLSEGGLAVAAAEMAFAGGLGLHLRLGGVPCEVRPDVAGFEAVALFAESNTRFLCEVPRTKVIAFEKLFADLPHAAIGEVTTANRLQIAGAATEAGKDWVVDADLAALKEAWQKPLRW